MNRQTRTALVLTIAVLTAGLASYGVYEAVKRMPVRQVEVDAVDVVVAAEDLPVGTRLRSEQLKVVAWPARTPVPGAFSDPKALVDRGVISTIGTNEPITATKVAGLESGAGLPPVIPQGMRAMSIRVNDVIGVAGYVVPGTRVDVLVTVREDGPENGRQDPIARTVVSNVEVLTAGTAIDQTRAKDGKPQPATVVTLALTPEDGEKIALAQSEGKLSLALRNPLDVEPTDTRGIKLTALMRGNGPAPAPPAAPARPATRRPAPRPVQAAPAPTPAPPAPAVYRVETIRGAKRTEEVVN